MFSKHPTSQKTTPNRQIAAPLRILFCAELWIRNWVLPSPWLPHVVTLLCFILGLALGAALMHFSFELGASMALLMPPS